MIHVHMIQCIFIGRCDLATWPQLQAKLAYSYLRKLRCAEPQQRHTLQEGFAAVASSSAASWNAFGGAQMARRGDSRDRARRTRSGCGRLPSPRRLRSGTSGTLIWERVPECATLLGWGRAGGSRVSKGIGGEGSHNGGKGALSFELHFGQVGVGHWVVDQDDHAAGLYGAKGRGLVGSLCRKAIGQNGD